MKFFYIFLVFDKIMLVIEKNNNEYDYMICLEKFFENCLKLLFNFLI